MLNKEEQKNRTKHRDMVFEKQYRKYLIGGKIRNIRCNGKVEMKSKNLVSAIHFHY